MTSLPLVGRDAELARVRALLADAIGGVGGALVLDGAPGAGKSRLLDEAVRVGADHGFEVRRAAGRVVERHIDGAVVSQLVGHHDTSPPAVHDAVCAAARRRPVLWAVDDVQWGDPASVAAVAYAARRLVGHSAAVLLALGAEPLGGERSAGSSATRQALDGLERLHIDGLDANAVLALFECIAGSLHPPVAPRVVELTGGLPMAVVELARLSTPEQRSGDVPFPDLPAVSEAMVRAFAGPLVQLPEPTRRVLCVVAAEPSGQVDVVARAVAALGESFADLEPAEAAGVVVVRDGRVVFDHPMRRVVAYASLALPSRRAAHRALAAAWSGPDDSAHRLRHRVAGAAGPDDQLADDLQLLAEHLQRSGRLREAVEAWRHAGQLSIDAARCAQRAKSSTEAQRQLDSRRDELAGPLSTLSKAELRVARVIAEGLSNRQAAERLFVSAKTIDAQLQAIFRKLAVNSRAQLAVLVTRHDMAGGGAR
ncbi:MAG: LuxR C-terminal-related transcriptional regulator [Actinomycetota bacterium]|nr:LuxR C-terminal-related transcriptional regulator [Actinomycetota bacterium]